METAMLLSTEGLPGPVTSEKIGEAGHHQAQIGARTGGPFVLQARAVRPRISMLASAPVMASKPVAKTMASSIVLSLGGSDAGAA